MNRAALVLVRSGAICVSFLVAACSDSSPNCPVVPADAQAEEASEPPDAAGEDTISDDANLPDAGPDSASDPCTAALVGCVPSLGTFGAAYCANVEADDPCAQIIIDAHQSEGCSSECDLAIPGLRQICTSSACADFLAALTASHVLTDECSTCACTPDCDGKACGPDGCGGDCGSCDEGAYCDLDQQCASLDPGCEGVTPLGCCPSEGFVTSCEAGLPVTTPCDSSTVCAWLPQAAGYVCVPEAWADDPPAWVSPACPASACVPSQELCDGISQQCSAAVDLEEPDVMCSPLYPGVPGVAQSNGWLCDPPAPGVDGCKIDKCQDEYFDLNGVPDDGCECRGTSRVSSLGTCSGAAQGSLGAVSMGQTITSVVGSVPLIDNGVGAEAEDWYWVSFPNSPLGTVEVDFAVNDGLDYRFTVATSCVAVPFSGLATIFGVGAPPARKWIYGPVAATPSTGEAVGVGTSLGIVFIRVFRVQNDKACNTYQLRVRRF